MIAVATPEQIPAEIRDRMDKAVKSISKDIIDALNETLHAGARCDVSIQELVNVSFNVGITIAAQITASIAAMNDEELEPILEIATGAVQETARQSYKAILVNSRQKQGILLS